jgi:hypothetical protein
MKQPAPLPKIRPQSSPTTEKTGSPQAPKLRRRQKGSLSLSLRRAVGQGADDGARRASSRAAILTPSPIRSPSLSSTRLPTWMPIRISRFSGTPALRSTIAFCTSMAQRTASTALQNSTMLPSAGPALTLAYPPSIADLLGRSFAKWTPIAVHCTLTSTIGLTTCDRHMRSQTVSR